MLPTCCAEQRGVYTGHGELPAQRGGPVRPADRHGGAAAGPLAGTHQDPREQRHQPSQHGDCQGEHPLHHRLHLSGEHILFNFFLYNTNSHI